MTFDIRFARPEDEKDWRRLRAAYLEFYKVNIDDSVTDAIWARILDPEQPIAMRVAAIPGGLLGFAIYLRHLSTWVKEPDCSLRSGPIHLGEMVGELFEKCEERRRWARLYWHYRRE